MNRVILLMLSLILLFSSEMMRATTNDNRHVLSYKIFNTSNHSITPTNQTFPNKSLRHNSQAGQIFILCDETTPEPFKISAQAAADYWSAAIKNRQPIYIKLEPSNKLEDDVALLCNAIYAETDTEYIPSALQSQIDDFAYGSPESPDAVIFFNENLDWNFRFIPEGNENEGNAYSHFLRAIPICLGFGSSVTYYEKEPDKIVFQGEKTTVFDNYIKSKNGTTLKSLQSGSQELKRFVENNELYFNDNNSKQYLLYTTNPFKLGKSLIYLNNPNSIMHYDFGNGDFISYIDDTTTEILNQIGWEKVQSQQPNPSDPATDFYITCDNIGDDGIGCAQDSLFFHLKSKSGAKSSGRSWVYGLYLPDGTLKRLAGGRLADCFVKPVSNPEIYMRNSSGNLVGIMYFNYKVGDTVYRTPNFNFTLEVGPQIIDIYDLQRDTSSDGYSFNLTFNVRYSDADYIKVEIEEEYDTGIRTEVFDEPMIAHVTTGEISKYFKTMVHVTAVKGDKTDTHTIELLPETYMPQQAETLPIATDNSYYATEFVLYNMEGKAIAHFSKISDIRSLSIRPGIYVLCGIRNNQIITRQKIAIR